MKKYYKTLKEAKQAQEKLIQHFGQLSDINVYKMPKGTRHHGEYAVCTHLEFINTL